MSWFQNVCLLCVLFRAVVCLLEDDSDAGTAENMDLPEQSYTNLWEEFQSKNYSNQIFSHGEHKSEKEDVVKWLLQPNIINQMGKLYKGNGWFKVQSNRTLTKTEQVMKPVVEQIIKDTLSLSVESSPLNTGQDHQLPASLKIGIRFPSTSLTETVLGSGTTSTSLVLNATSGNKDLNKNHFSSNTISTEPITEDVSQPQWFNNTQTSSKHYSLSKHTFPTSKNGIHNRGKEVATASSVDRTMAIQSTERLSISSQNNILEPSLALKPSVTNTPLGASTGHRSATGHFTEVFLLRNITDPLIFTNESVYTLAPQILFKTTEEEITEPQMPVATTYFKNFTTQPHMQSQDVFSNDSIIAEPQEQITVLSGNRDTFLALKNKENGSFSEVNRLVYPSKKGTGENVSVSLIKYTVFPSLEAAWPSHDTNTPLSMAFSIEHTHYLEKGTVLRDLNLNADSVKTDPVVHSTRNVDQEVAIGVRLNLKKDNNKNFRRNTGRSSKSPEENPRKRKLTNHIHKMLNQRVQSGKENLTHATVVATGRGRGLKRNALEASQNLGLLKSINYSRNITSEMHAHTGNFPLKPAYLFQKSSLPPRNSSHNERPSQILKRNSVYGTAIPDDQSYFSDHQELHGVKDISSGSLYDIFPSNQNSVKRMSLRPKKKSNKKWLNKKRNSSGSNIPHKMSKPKQWKSIKNVKKLRSEKWKYKSVDGSLYDSVKPGYHVNNNSQFALRGRQMEADQLEVYINKSRLKQSRDATNAAETSSDGHSTEAEFQGESLSLLQQMVGPTKTQQEFITSESLLANASDVLSANVENVLTSTDDMQSSTAVESTSFISEMAQPMTSEMVQTLSSDETQFLSTTESLPSLKLETFPSLTAETLPTSTLEYLPSSTIESRLFSATESSQSTTESVLSSTKKSLPLAEVDALPPLPSLPSSTMESLPSSTMESLPSSAMEPLPSSAMESLPSSAMESLPSSAMESLPSSAMESLPSSAMESLPSSTIEFLASTAEPLPSSTMEPLPSSTMESLPSSTMESLPSSTMESLPSSTMESLPSSAMESLSFSAMEFLPASAMEALPSSTMESLPSSTMETLQSSTIESLPSVPVEPLQLLTVESVTLSAKELSSTIKETSPSTVIGPMETDAIVSQLTTMKPFSVTSDLLPYVPVFPSSVESHPATGEQNLLFTSQYTPSNPTEFLFTYGESTRPVHKAIQGFVASKVELDQPEKTPVYNNRIPVLVCIILIFLAIFMISAGLVVHYKTSLKAESSVIYRSLRHFEEN